MNRIALRLVVALAVVCAARVASAQPQVQVGVGVEVSRDRSTYHFDNPSNFDTSVTVPHFFEQYYVLDNVWLTASARYRAGIDWHTTVGLTPVRQALATDYDTFFDPGNVTWVSGTTGDARMHAFRLAQEVDLGRAGSVYLHGGYRLRMDLADFLDGDKTDSRNGAVVSRSVVSTREFTNAQAHAVYVSATHERTLSSTLRLMVSGELAPASVSRLAIQLPDKYPGRTIVYRTTNMATTGEATLAVGSGRWPVALTLRGGRMWNYHPSQRAQHTTLSLGLAVGRTW